MTTAKQLDNKGLKDVDEIIETYRYALHCSNLV